MGSDNLFHKRKKRLAASHRRRQAQRSPYDMVLIVCEGQKTEPNYFRSLINDFQLNTANVKVADNTAGSSPRSVVEFALKEYRQSKEYDQIFCVFNKDQHLSYLEALSTIKQARLAKGHAIRAITSVPCFEFWLLLHFAYTTKTFGARHGSICASVISDLKRHLPGYQKGKLSTFQVTKDHLAEAISNAKNVSKYCIKGDTDNPSTLVHELVEFFNE